MLFRSQLSYTILTAQQQDGFSLNSFLINYRYQVVNKDRIALAPRLSVQLPVNKKSDQGWGIQVNMPASLDLNDKLFIHLNAGANYAWNYPGSSDPSHYLQVPLGASLIYCPHPLINLMCEFLHTTNTAYQTGHFETNESFNSVVTTNELVINPGIRCAINFKNGLQIVPGVAIPITFSESCHQTGYQFYLSFEHPFKKS